MNHLRRLHDGWTLRHAGGAAPPGWPAAGVPARVPGCVHTDLLAAGLIPDPYLDRDEESVAWIGRADWEYRTTFDHRARRSGRVDLLCAGLDTVAAIALNGAPVGATANMHRSYRFDVARLLRERGNTLTIRFTSPYRYAEAVRDAVGARPASYGGLFPYIRKMACDFGWDWGPALASSGIWQPIGLHAWSVARLAEVRPLVRLDGGTGTVSVHVRVERDGRDDRPLEVGASVAGRTGTAPLPAGATGAVVELRVPRPRLWWPRGYGAPARYPLRVWLARDGGPALDTWRREIGFRTVTVDTAPDPDGRPFTLVVNETKVFVRGMNWIPDDALPTRVDRARYAARLDQACGAGANYLRVWGGGRYESEDFYDLADERGLMVGQDFLFACAAYPEEEPLAGEVEAEAREQVARLVPHPSLVLWTGNNENIWGWHDWGWRERLGEATWGLGYYLDVLPRVVSELDPTRPYWPGSPYSGSMAVHPNDPSYGTCHIWDVWNVEDYAHYRDWRPRFVAEFGFQGPPAYATLRRAIHDDPLAPDSPGMLWHQKADGGNAKLDRGLSGHLPRPDGFDDWHWATQLNQARAVSLGIEHFRSLRPLCGGTILWQLNDCWPVTSWSCVDGDGRLKPVWYAVRRGYADRLVTIQPRTGARGGHLAAVVVNDGCTAWRAVFDVIRYRLDGRRLATAPVRVRVPAGGSATVELPAEVATPGDPTAELLVADYGYGRATWYFVEDPALSYPAPEYGVTVGPAAGGVAVRVHAGAFLRDLTLLADRLDPAAVVDRALVTLLPGESATFRVRTALRPDPAALSGPPVLRSANDLAARG